ncbi:MAG: ArsR family transcriptional regulator [Propionibacteriaceae bacterium]|nr:ArsR family transcriptional regulator [Propionibacteriaceae bacterium]
MAATYLSPHREFSVTELAKLAKASLKSTAQEVDRLVKAGILNDRRSGNQRLVCRPAPSRIVTPLAELLASTYGPLPVLTEELSGMKNIQKAYIFGSWAARHAGLPGQPPDDIDVLVIGSPTLDELDNCAEQASARLHRAVNIRRISPELWANNDKTDPFLTTVKESELTEILL